MVTDNSFFPPKHHWPAAQCCRLDLARSFCVTALFAKLVYNSNVTMVYGKQITIVTGAYKPTNITGGAHIVTGFRTRKVTWLRSC